MREPFALDASGHYDFERRVDVAHAKRSLPGARVFAGTVPMARAMEFPGAYDISLLARLMVEHRLDRLLPAQELLTDNAGEAFRLPTPWSRTAG